ncbi:MAG: lipid-A-disaccharide synthase [Pseudomonadota bacterium]
MSPQLYLIAGEPSGDRLGAALIEALKAEAPDVRFSGLGGPQMQAAGLSSLFDTEELSVMGIAEVIPRLPRLLRRISQTTADVLAKAPDILVTIDSPSFGLRVAERVRKTNPAIRTVHYVAPSVWAWRPGRAAHMARFIDHVLAILPFEPPYMEAAGMSCDFVGHPIASRAETDLELVAKMRGIWGVAPDQRLLLVGPGSRRSEVKHLLPPFSEAIARLATRHPGLHVVIPMAETVLGEVESAARNLAVEPILIHPSDGEEMKQIAFAAADAALIASGTITLEMAAAGTPMVACYKTSWLTAAIVRRLIKAESANLVNLTVGRPVVPELYQEAATVDAMVSATGSILRKGDARKAQIEAFAQAMTALGREGIAPARLAARSVLRQLPGGGAQRSSTAT